MVKVYVYPADFWGCGHYRSVWPATAVGDANDDWHVTIVPPGHPTGLSAVVDQREDKILEVMYPRDADLIVLQRPTHQHLAQAVPILRKKGIAVVVDIDDDLSCVHPSNPAWAIMHPRNHNTVHSWNNVTQACRAATLVTVSSEALKQRYGRHGRVALLRNCVPQAYLDVPRVDNNTVGWAGSTHSHPGDLKAMGRVIRSITNDGFSFMVVGDGTGSARDLNLNEDPPHSGAIDFGKWASAVAQIGIGVAPLLDTKFNAAKSWLKPLEYAACGVPWVGSARAEYLAFKAEGSGFVAFKDLDWERLIRALLTSPSLREEVSARGRDVARRWTYEANEWQWREAWAAALELQSRSSVVEA